MNIFYLLASKFTLIHVHAFSMHYDGNVLKISGVCFKVIYLMTNQRLSSNLKRNIFLTNILANAPLKISPTLQRRVVVRFSPRGANDNSTRTFNCSPFYERQNQTQSEI